MACSSFLRRYMSWFIAKIRAVESSAASLGTNAPPQCVSSNRTYTAWTGCRGWSIDPQGYLQALQTRTASLPSLAASAVTNKDDRNGIRCYWQHPDWRTDGLTSNLEIEHPR